MFWRTTVRGAGAGPNSWQPARRALGLRVRIGAVVKCWYVCKHVCIIDAAMTSLCSHSQYHHQTAAAAHACLRLHALLLTRVQSSRAAVCVLGRCAHSTAHGVRRYMHAYIHIYTHAYIQMHAYIHTYIHTTINTHTRPCIYTYIHT